MSNGTVEDGKVVTFHYTLKNEEGEVLDTSSEGEPMDYLHGAGNIVPGLEKTMAGCAAGDHFEVTVAPEEAYGERQGQGPIAVPRSSFPEDAPVQAGMTFVSEMPDGRKFPIWIVEVREEDVLVDGNHPLAGVTLVFDVNVVGKRDASAEEKEHGHPHVEESCINTP